MDTNFQRHETRIASKYDSYNIHEKNNQHCTIILLDNSDFKLVTSKHVYGNEVFGKVCQHLQIRERDYFGLSFNKDSSNKKDWLVLSEPVSKQTRNVLWHFWFEVKFYPPEPSLLRDESAKFHLCLQIRNDIVSGKLPCSAVTNALLGSYLVQSQFGDYDSKKHGPPEIYLANCSFAPKQNVDLLRDICELHKLRKGKSSSEAESLYLENAKKLAMYGVDLHEAKDKEDRNIFLGVCSSGLLVYQGSLRLNRFAWPKILKISFRRNQFWLKLRPGEVNPKETKVYFKLSTETAAERLWKSCVEHHTFFRLMRPEKAPDRSFFRIGSTRFNFDGRTQYESRLANGISENNPFNGRRSFSGPLICRSAENVRDNNVPSQSEVKRPVSTMITHVPINNSDEADFARPISFDKPIPQPRKPTEVTLTEITYARPHPLEGRRYQSEERCDSAIGLDAPNSENGVRNYSSPETLDDAAAFAVGGGGDASSVDPVRLALDRIARKRARRDELSRAKRQNGVGDGGNDLTFDLLSPDGNLIAPPFSHSMVVLEGTPIADRKRRDVKTVENTLQRAIKESPRSRRTSTPAKSTALASLNVFPNTDDSAPEKSTISTNLNPRNLGPSNSISPNGIISNTDTKSSPSKSPGPSKVELATMPNSTAADIESNVILSSPTSEADHDAELAAAILHAMHMKTDLNVEKLEYKRASNSN